MELLSDLTAAVAVLSFLFMAIGLYRPWIMLWWEDTQNRRKIIKVYGASALLFSLFHMVLNWLS
ncbi:MAG: hypothetical protein MJA30_22445 [Cytophagales bacterium]|nr:hypothetical protein [Cytophagales bacterium]